MQLLRLHGGVSIEGGHGETFFNQFTILENLAFDLIEALLSWENSCSCWTSNLVSISRRALIRKRWTWNFRICYVWRVIGRRKLRLVILELWLFKNEGYHDILIGFVEFVEEWRIHEAILHSFVLPLSPWNASDHGCVWQLWHLWSDLRNTFWIIFLLLNHLHRWLLLLFSFHTSLLLCRQFMNFCTRMFFTTASYG